jgi:amino acid transporter
VLSSTTFALILAFCGFRSISVGVAEVESSYKLVLGIGGLIGGIYILSSIIMCFFKVNEEKSREYAEHNHKVMMERQAAAAAAKSE